MLIYTVLPLYVLIWAWGLYNPNKDKNRYNFELFLVLFVQVVLLFGLRHSGILDEYSIIWNRMDFSGSVFDVPDIRLEKGFLIYQKIIHNCISSNYVIYFLITTLFGVGATMLFIYKRSSLFWFPFFLYVCSCALYLQIDAFRQGIAVSIILFAYYLFDVNNRNTWIRTGLLIFLATTFHQTAILTVMLFLYIFIEPSKKSIVIFTISSILIILLMDSFVAFMNAAESKYLKNETFQLGNILQTFLYTSFLYIAYKAEPQTFFKDKLLFWGALMTILCFILSLYITALNRAAAYFNILFFIHFSTCVSKSLNKRMLFGLSISIMLAFYYIILYYKPEWYHTTDFAFFWEDYRFIK